MGYHTDFSGAFIVTPVLSRVHRLYLAAFAETRRLARLESIVATLDDPLRVAVGLDVGLEGAYFVGGAGFAGQDKDESVLDFNAAPGAPRSGWATGIRPLTAHELKRRAGGYQREVGTPCVADHQHHLSDECELACTALEQPGAQPGLWCQWVPSEAGTMVEWDGNEKFYAYVEWIKYLLENFLIPWGYELTGEVFWQGEEPDDRGKMKLEANELTVYEMEYKYRKIAV